MAEKMTQNEQEGGQEEGGLLEMIDALILHINAERTWFNILVLTSILAAPISLFFTLSLLLHRRLVFIIFRVDPILGAISLIYFGIILIVASLWLAVGIREYTFLSKWNSRFKKYFSLKEQLDKELRKEFDEKNSQ